MLNAAPHHGHKCPAPKAVTSPRTPWRVVTNAPLQCVPAQHCSGGLLPSLADASRISSAARCHQRAYEENRASTRPLRKDWFPSARSARQRAWNS